MNRIEERYINLNVIVKLEDFVEDDEQGLIEQVKVQIDNAEVYQGNGCVIVTKVEVDTDKGLERR